MMLGLLGNVLGLMLGNYHPPHNIKFSPWFRPGESFLHHQPAFPLWDLQKVQITLLQAKRSLWTFKESEQRT